ncbi:MAG: TRAP transporter large permease [Clostridia bacterium]|nr:TRAP transporter large permease [Clostridia bacterium]
MELLISILILMVTLIIGVPVPFCFGASVIWLVVTLGYDPSFLLPVGYSKMSSIVLLAIPLFILAGGLIEKGKIGEALVNFVELFVGRIKGGLGAVAVISCAIFGSISGSASATLSCIGSIMFPKLDEAKYPRGLSAALISNAAPLGLLIPPSSIQILYAWIGNQSVLACFLATIVPGLILTVLLCIVNFYFARNNKEIVIQEPVSKQAYKKMFVKRTKRVAPAMFMPFVVLGGIYGGIMTPTEAAAVAVLYSVPVGFLVYRGLNMKNFKSALVETATTTGVIMVMFYVVMILSRLFIMENLPNKMIDILTAISPNKYVILVMVNIFMVIIGMLMDDVSGVLLATPVLLPLVTELGVSPVHFAAILGVNLGMGNITPPTAPLLYLGARIGKAKINEMMTPTMAMIIFAWIPTLIITTYFPQVALFLPTKLLGAL